MEQETIKTEETRKQPSRLEGSGGAPFSKVIGAVLTVGVLGFWFGFGAALGAKMGPGARRDPWLTVWKSL